MRDLVTAYTFDKTAKTITLTSINPIVGEKVLGVWNATRGVKYYDPHVTGYSATFATNVITLVDAVTSSHANTDDLIIFYEGVVSTDLATEATLQQASDRIDNGNTILGNLYAGTSMAQLGAILADIELATASIDANVSTAAKQDTGNASLATIATNTGNGATAANQVSQFNMETNIRDEVVLVKGYLQLINDNIPAKGSAAMTASQPVTIATDDTLTSNISTRVTSISGQLPAVLTAGGNLAVAVRESIPAGTNNIGDVDVASIGAGTNVIGQVYISPRTTKQLTNANVSFSSSGENTIVSGTASQTIRVFAICLVAASPVTLTIKSSAGGGTLATIPLTANGSFSFTTIESGEPLWVTDNSGAFVISLSSAVSVVGFIQYTKS